MQQTNVLFIWLLVFTYVYIHLCASTPARSHICNNLRRIHSKSTRLTSRLLSSPIYQLDSQAYNYLRSEVQNREQLLSALAVYWTTFRDLNYVRKEYTSYAEDDIRRTLDKLVSLIGSTVTASHTTQQVPVEKDAPLSLISTNNRIYHIAARLNQLLHFALQTPLGRSLTGLESCLMH